MRTGYSLAVAATAAAAVFALSACGSEDEQTPGAGGEPAVVNPDLGGEAPDDDASNGGGQDEDPDLGAESDAEGSADPLEDPQDGEGGTPDSTEEGWYDYGEDDLPGDQPQRDKPAEFETPDSEAPADAEEAVEQALEDSQRLDEEFDRPEPMSADEMTTMDGARESVARLHQVELEAARIIATHYPGPDYNRDQSAVRATHLFSEGFQAGVSDRPISATDESWVSAAECGARPEVRVQAGSTEIEVNEYGRSDGPDGYARYIAQYQWVDGDEGCRLVQPDHFYEIKFYGSDFETMTIGGYELERRDIATNGSPMF